MPAIDLTPAERKDLRGRAHNLDPVVTIGAGGLTPALLKEADAALCAHGLIKVRMFSDLRDERQAALALLADRLGAAPVQHIGKLLVLWRPVAARTTAKAAPDGRGAGPRTVKIIKFPRSPHHRPQVKKVRVLGNQRVSQGGSIKRARTRTVSVKKNPQPA